MATIGVEFDRPMQLIAVQAEPEPIPPMTAAPHGIDPWILFAVSSATALGGWLFKSFIQPAQQQASNREQRVAEALEKERDSDNKLLRDLIADMQLERKQGESAIRDLMRGMLENEIKIAATLDEMRALVRTLTETQQRMIRDLTLIFSESRTTADKLTVLESKVEALHERLDRNAVPPSH